MFFDRIITEKVPARHYGLDGLTVHADHTSTGTIYFVSASKDVSFPAHTHARQWTVVVSGCCEVTMDGETKIYTKGDTYVIPAEKEHRITLFAGYSEVDYVDDPHDGE